jgi:hypothetical protein
VVFGLLIVAAAPWLGGVFSELQAGGLRLVYRELRGDVDEVKRDVGETREQTNSVILQAGALSLTPQLGQDGGTAAAAPSDVWDKLARGHDDDGSRKCRIASRRST